MEVRRARLSDDAALLRIDALTWTSAVSPAAARTDRTSFFDDRTTPSDVLVAEADAGVVGGVIGCVIGYVIGYVQVQQAIPLPSHVHVLEISGLAVDPERRRSGAGRALVEAAVEEARRRGARKLSLRVLAGNTAARRLYDACGFEAEGVLREEFLLDGRYVDDVLMARHLAGAR